MSSGRTLLYGLIGDPVTHSLSPFIMNRAFSEIGLDAVYMAFGIRRPLLETALNGLYAMGSAGVNVTFPFKEEVLYHLDVISSDADLAQAVNTIVFFDGEVHGFNTDAPGTATALEHFGDVPLEGESAFIYGCGGSARAAAYGLLERGVDRVVFGVRSPDSAEMVVERYRFAFPEQRVDMVPLLDTGLRAKRREAIRDASVVINATPVGMAGVAEGTLIEDPAWIRTGQCYFDFVYHPVQTPFLQAARTAGAKTLGGIALLVSQAAETFRLWTDHSFDLNDMAQATELFSRTGAKPARGVN